MVSREQLTALAIVGLVVAAVVVGAVVYATLQLRGSGKIRVVGVKAFSDAAATLEVSSIDWGVISPGGQSQVLLYLKSTSTVPVNLTLSTGSWQPSNASAYMTLTWDYDGRALQPSEVRSIRFTLRVMDTIHGITDFSFTLTITAAG